MSHNKIVMKTKHILALVAFVATFFFSSLLVSKVLPKALGYRQPQRVFSTRGCSVPTNQRITQLIQQDIYNTNNFRDNYSNGLGLAARTENYVNASENLSYEDLPIEFQNAWLNHMRAWRKQANLYNTLETDYIEDTAILRMKYRNSDEINRTWWEVLRIAKQNGAIIPSGAY